MCTWAVSWSRYENENAPRRAGHRGSGAVQRGRLNAGNGENAHTKETNAGWPLGSSCKTTVLFVVISGVFLGTTVMSVVTAVVFFMMHGDGELANLPKVRCPPLVSRRSAINF